ncbi:major facilitator superfamily domain-containing protein [Lipomyces starkeyi]
MAIDKEINGLSVEQDPTQTIDKVAASHQPILLKSNIAIPQSKQNEHEERVYVQRIDRYIFLYALLSDWIKYSTRRTSAMLTFPLEHMHGQERNLLTTFFNIGYLTGAIPSQIILNRVRPSILIPTAEVLWSVLVMLLAACKTTYAMYGLRFLIGLCEALSAHDELGKRVSLFGIAWSVAAMFSGYIQAGVYTSMNGRYGIAGWKCLFIIDGIISIPIAVLGFYCIPDFRTTTRARWLNSEQREYGIQRMAAIGRKPPRKLTVRRFVNLFKTWRPYAFLGPYCIGSFGGSTGYFNLWLKIRGHHMRTLAVGFWSLISGAFSEI